MFRAAQLGRISVAFAEAAAYQQWVQDQEDINAAEVAIGVPSRGPSERFASDEPMFMSLEHDVIFQASEKRMEMRFALAVEQQRGYPGLVDECTFFELQLGDQLNAVTNLPVALLDHEYVAVVFVAGVASMPFDLIQPPPLQAGFELPVVSPRPGPFVSADCLAA